MKAQLFDKGVWINAPSGSTVLVILVAKADALIFSETDLAQVKRSLLHVTGEIGYNPSTMLIRLAAMHDPIFTR